MGHPVLREKARAIERNQITAPATQRLIDDMIETMTEYRGVGLAAPQIHHGLRLFVASLDAGNEGKDDEKESEPVAIINPEIVPVGSEVVEDWEGCLSIPDIRGRVPRARDIRLRAFNRAAERIELNVSGYSARVLQHETDHLDGILFLDRMRSFESLTFLDEYSRYWREEGDE